MKKSAVLALAFWLFALPAFGATRTLTFQDNADNETGFQVERCPGDCSATGVWTVIGKLAPNVTTYTTPDMAAGSKWSYRVGATGPAGTGYSTVLVWTEPGPTQAPTSISFSCPSGMVLETVTTATKIDATCK